MTAIIEAHGCKFSLEGDGFAGSNTTANFYRIADDLECRLLKMGPDEVRVLRAGVEQDAETQEFASQDAFDRLQAIADAVCAAETAGWHDPSAVVVMVGGA